jgi:hypothetical protein
MTPTKLTLRNLLTDKDKSIQITDLLRLIQKTDKMMNNKPIDIEDGASFSSLIVLFVSLFIDPSPSFQSRQQPFS